MVGINASIVANFFLKKGLEDNIRIDPMKLIKLVYIAHGWCLAVLDQDLLHGEKVEAWQHGPVIPSLYHEFKRFGKNQIDDDQYSWSLVSDQDDEFKNKVLFINDLSDVDKSLKKKVITILDTVWHSYRNYSGWGLSQKTHEEDSPWSVCWWKK